MALASSSEGFIAAFMDGRGEVNPRVLNADQVRSNRGAAVEIINRWVLERK